MLKSVVLWVLVLHGVCEFSSLAHPFSADTHILNFAVPDSSNINDKDAKILRIVEPKVNYNFNITIFYLNDVPSIGTTASTTESTTVPTIKWTTESPTESITESTIESTETLATPSQKGYIVTNGIGAHKVYTIEQTWSQARQICIEDGGDLAVIRSDAEEQIMKKMVMGSGLINPWIGFDSRPGKQHWVCVSNEEDSAGAFISWKGNNAHKVGADYHVFNYDGTLSTIVGCYTNRPFICKITTI